LEGFVEKRLVVIWIGVRDHAGVPAKAQSSRRVLEMATISIGNRFFESLRDLITAIDTVLSQLFVPNVDNYF